MHVVVQTGSLLLFTSTENIFITILRHLNVKTVFYLKSYILHCFKVQRQLYNFVVCHKLTHLHFLLFRWESLLLMTMYGIYIIIMK